MIAIRTSAKRWRAIASLAVILAGFSSVTELRAAPANGGPFDFVQPNGTKITLSLRGDEFFHWHEDMNGFVVVRVGDAFFYARVNAAQQLEATDWLVGTVDPASKGLTPKMLPPKNARPHNLNDGQRAYQPWLRTSQSNAATKNGSSAVKKGGVNPDIPASGTVKNVVILALFNDQTIPTSGHQQSDYDVICNKVGGDPTLAPTGSVKDMYSEMSYGQVTIQSTVFAWVTLPHPMAYYAGSNNGLQTTEPNTQTMARDALAAADSIIDFGQFDQDKDGYVDAIDVIHSGYGAEQGGAPANSIWSVKWFLPSDWVSADNNSNGVKVKVKNFHTEAALYGSSGSDITHIAVIGHETGHFFGLPDLYDTDNSSDGIGSWCLMANDWGFDGSQQYPPHMSAWCKIFLGWETATLLTNPGTYSVTQAETTKSVYRIDRGFTPSEYLLIENRQPAGKESDIPQGGLCIWQIDESVSGNTNEGYPGQPGWPGNGNHYKVALLQADGRYDLEKISHGSAKQRGDGTDVYRGGVVNAIGMNTVPNTDRYKLGTAGPTANRITNISASGSTMTFDYSFPASVLYVDNNYTGSSTGAPDQPYKTVHDAYNAAVAGTTIVIRSASYTESPLTNLNKQVIFDSRLGSSTIK